MPLKKTVAVIGGGASGLAAAIQASRTFNDAGADYSVLLLERMPRVGKKLLATGNGKCNFANTCPGIEKYHGDTDFAKKALDCFGLNETLDFFKSVGVAAAEKDGRLYPYSFSANAVLDCLRFEAERLNVSLICGKEVKELAKAGSGFLIDGSIKADSVIVAAGGKSASIHGSNGSGYALLTALGHRLTPVFPALVQLVCADDFCKQLKGIRAMGSITLFDGEKALKKEYGEIQFTDYGLSGIAAMQTARYAQAPLSEGRAVTAVIDLAADFTEQELCRYIEQRRDADGKLKCENLLIGLLPKRLAEVILKSCSVPPQSRTLSSLTPDEIRKTAKCIKALCFRVSGTKGFSSSQVTAGGIDTADFEPVTFRSKKVGGLYACGEILNVDGDCGGYNLQWAWCSGCLAGKSCAEELLNA